ncbi:MAG: helix-turn-helix domain-containing protein [Pacificimonas sp.]
MAATPKTEGKSNLRTNEQKWSKPLMEAGWTALPSVIIENQKQLGLDAIDMNIIMYLASKWWTAEGKPYPSKGTMAKAMQLHPRTVQKHIAALEGVGFIKREERRTKLGSKTNIYHLDGLIEAAMPFAEEKLDEIAERRAIAKIKANRRGAPRKPALRLVKDED